VRVNFDFKTWAGGAQAILKWQPVRKATGGEGSDLKRKRRRRTKQYGRVQ